MIQTSATTFQSKGLEFGEIQEHIDDVHVCLQPLRNVIHTTYCTYWRQYLPKPNSNLFKIIVIYKNIIQSFNNNMLFPAPCLRLEELRWATLSDCPNEIILQSNHFLIKTRCFLSYIPIYLFN